MRQSVEDLGRNLRFVQDLTLRGKTDPAARMAADILNGFWQYGAYDALRRGHQPTIRAVGVVREVVDRAMANASLPV